jgi:hypothetical protein
MTAPRIVRFDWHAFRAHVASLRLEHETRPPAEGVRRSLEAFARWGVAPPQSFFEQHPEVAAAGRTPDTHTAATRV